jgi:hypothetical protein
MRSLISDKCEQHSSFRFVTMDGRGRICCASNEEAGICDECRRATAKPTMRPPRTELPPVAVQHQDAGSRTFDVSPLRERQSVPPPPSLSERIKAARAAAGRGLTVLAGVGTNRNGVPNPPRLGVR